MKEGKQKDLKIIVTVVGGITVVTNIKKGGVIPKTYSEIIDALKVAQQIWEEKKIIHGDSI